MNRLSIIRYLSLTGGGLLLLGTTLPLLAKNGVVVTGWDGDYLSVGRWILLLAGVGATLVWVIPQIRKPLWMTMSGLVGFFQAMLVIWKGYKLQAIGLGAWVLLLGGILILLAAFLYSRSTALATKKAN